MKKKGFTLIELLAVIVILAIIALIATPLVLKYIEKSRKESKVDSAYSFVRNLETEIANFSIKNKGQKFNISPKNGEFYEYSDFGKDIDTTVKGDKPDTIKVCLSSLGQVEKAMFEYGNSYVSYDGKKGSISNKDTYDNFSCSGNVAGGNSCFEAVGESVFEGEIEFNNDASAYFVEITMDDFNKFEAGKIYGLEVGSDICAIMYSNYSNGGTMVYMQDEDQTTIAMVDSADASMIYLAVMSQIVIPGKQTVKIVEAKDPYPDYGMKIQSYGYNWLYSKNFVEGNAHVYITDENSTVYCDKNITFEKNGDFVGQSSYDNTNLGNLDSVYNAITDGRTITVKVTQTVNGEEVVTTIGGITPEFRKEGNRDIYFWGNPMIPSAS